ncbi:MAG: YkgJ family cysteine cluster protein [Cyanobacteria bacterium]|nr:YkgJ family cysteine cluster protein [Cyanobacteriota bacterium]
MPNAFETELGVPLPACCSNGDCCKGASPSKPYHVMLRRAAEGDEFARNFFSIMQPYSSAEAAAKVVPGLVEKTMVAARKSPDFPNNEDDVVFYHCRYLIEGNRCGVHEDRPQFCRDYPDTPFVVMAPGCAFIPWANTCRAKYEAMKDNIAELETLREELKRLKSGQSNAAYIDVTGLNDDNTGALSDVSPEDLSRLSIVLSLTSLYAVSPISSFYFHYSIQRKQK